MKRRTTLALMIAVAGSMFASTPALAQESPLGCTANRLDLDILADRTDFLPGELINYTVEVSNLGGSGCDVSEVTIVFQYPGPDGKPSGPTRTLTASTRYNIGTPTITFGPFAHTAAINPGVDGLVARVSIANGRLHDPLNRRFNVDKEISVVQPSLSIDKVGSIESGQAPQNVVYTFYVKNTSTAPLPMNDVVVTDDKCGNPVYAGGDSGDGWLSKDEVWTFTCSMLHQAAGVYTNTAHACAYTRSNRTRPVCSPPDTWTVTLTSPPPAAPPQVAVKPTTAAQAPCTLSTPNGIVVRAKQLNTIRVRVRNVDAGSKVTITLPGSKKTVSAKTNASGIATLRVRPTKSGTARISAAECSEVESLRVRPARRVQAQNNPRVTG